MIRWLFLISMIQLISGCSTNRIPEHADQYFPGVKESVWKLTLEQWGTERFTGLLAVRAIGHDLHLVLLDATGIKLLEATKPDGEDIRVISAVKAVRDHSLPQYLSRSSSRIFGDTSNNVHCLRHGFIRICKKKIASDVKIKEACFGPFSVWSVDYFYGRDVSKGFVRAVLKEPWRHSRLTLELLKVHLTYDKKTQY